MGRNVDLRGQVSLVMGLWLVVVAAFMSRRSVENQPPQQQQVEQHLETIAGETSSSVNVRDNQELRYQPSDYLNFHNNARRAVGANIPNLRWSGALANYARNWAETRARANCNLMRSGGKYGESIFWSSWQSNPADAVNSWVAEKRFYNYNSNSCTAGQVCWHYTQVVWRDTKSVGCGSAKCPRGGKFVVCSYDPPGTRGQKPY